MSVLLMFLVENLFITLRKHFLAFHQYWGIGSNQKSEHIFIYLFYGYMDINGLSFARNTRNLFHHWQIIEYICILFPNMDCTDRQGFISNHLHSAILLGLMPQ